MKKISSLLFIASAFFVQAQTTQTFTYTGSVQTFTVPLCVTSITIDAKGAQGGDVSGTTACWTPGPVAVSGGLGGRTQCTLAVTPGQVLNICVGQQGTLTSGGYNGGGAPA